VGYFQGAPTLVDNILVVTIGDKTFTIVLQIAQVFGKGMGLNNATL
jgi:hypothetical protein